MSPFLMAKYELTQAQWQTMTDGETPSTFVAGSTDEFSKKTKPVTRRHPVETVSWDDVRLWLHRHRLARGLRELIARVGDPRDRNHVAREIVDGPRAAP